MLKRPQIVAHRGASERLPEHTLEAYVAALDDGAEALECDVRLTADGHLVCVHDRNLRRIAGNRGIVSQATLSDLDKLDFARWKNPWAELDDEAPEAAPGEGKVLTLRRLMETVRDYPRPVQLAIETKHPTRYAGLVERRLVQLLAEFGWTEADSPARVMSFSPVALTRVARQAPRLQLVLLIDTPSEWVRARPLIRRGWIAGPGIALLREHPDFVRKLVARGVRVHCWTVNTPEDLQLCLDLGISAVISDRPGWVRETLDV